MRTVDKQIPRGVLAVVVIDKTRYSVYEPTIKATLLHNTEREAFVKRFEEEAESAGKNRVLVEWLYREAEILFSDSLGDALGDLGESQRHKLVALALRLDDDDSGGSVDNPPLESPGEESPGEK